MGCTADSRIYVVLVMENRCELALALSLRRTRDAICENRIGKARCQYNHIITRYGHFTHCALVVWFTRGSRLAAPLATCEYKPEAGCVHSCVQYTGLI